jgi:hypothetical protein
MRTVTIRLPDDTHERLQALAEARGISGHGSQEGNTFGKAKNLNPLSNKDLRLLTPQKV